MIVYKMQGYDAYRGFSHDPHYDYLIFELTPHCVIHSKLTYPDAHLSPLISPYLSPKHLTMNALLIFIKNPMLGQAKTRLAATVGDDRALQIYEALLGHTRQVSLQVEAERFLFYSHFIDADDDWSPRDFRKYLQATGDLGQRMTTGFQEAFALPHIRKAVIIGSDCASLTPDIVAEAFRALDDHDFVLGPATDGGYYLLGMRSFHPEVFSGIDWSTEHVARQTLQAIAALGKSCAEVTTLSDIDYEEDWARYGWPLPGDS